MVPRTLSCSASGAIAAYHARGRQGRAAANRPQILDACNACRVHCGPGFGGALNCVPGYSPPSLDAPRGRAANPVCRGLGGPELQAAVSDVAEQHSAMPLELFCYLLLASSAAGTAALTGRFLLSCFPQLERKRKETPWVFLTASTDPVLEPLRKVFAENKSKLEGMDVASVAALGILTIIMETSFGPDGLLLSAIPYPAVQDTAQMLLITAKVFSLPMWLLLVFRWINYI